MSTRIDWRRAVFQEWRPVVGFETLLQVSNFGNLRSLSSCASSFSCKFAPEGQRVFYVYLHCKPDGTPFYVGKGCGDRYRRIQNRKHNVQYNRHVTKYGHENIRVVKIDGLTEQDAFDLECFCIFALRSQGVHLVNATDGGEGVSGRVLSDEERWTLYLYALDRKIKPETIEKIRAANTGKKRTQEQRLRFSMAQMGNHNSKGIAKTEEHRRKISLAKTGVKLGPMPEEGRKARSIALKGRVFSDEHRRKLSEAASRRGQKNHDYKN